MDTPKRHIGLIIKKIAKEKNMSAIELADKMQISRQGVYEAWSKANMSIDKIEQWADVLDVSAKQILDRIEGDDNKKVVSYYEGDEYLMRYIKQIEGYNKQLESQNSKLSEDLSKALDTIRELVGKSDSVSLVGFAAIIFMIIAPNLGTLVNEGNGIFFGVYLQ